MYVYFYPRFFSLPIVDTPNSFLEEKCIGH